MSLNNMSSIAPLHYQYSCLTKKDIPKKFILLPVKYRRRDIEEYELIFIHRLFKENYGDPSDIEWQDVKIGEKQWKPVKVTLGKEWKYFLKTDTGNLIQVGTENNASSLEINIILQSEKDIDEIIDETKESEKIKEVKKFIDTLLKEAKSRMKKFNLNKEIDGGENVVSFMATNLFFSNYICAGLMIEWLEKIMPEMLQDKLRGGELKIDNETDLDIIESVDKYLCSERSFLVSALLFYYMAIESFINLFYKSFLIEDYWSKSEIRKGESRFEKLPIDIKLIMMPHICHGFKIKNFDRKSETFQNLLRLSDYRNKIIHGKIIDAANEIFITEDQFSYCINRKKEQAFLPPNPCFLAKEHINLVKNIVDGIINDILAKLDEKTREFVTNTIKNSAYINFSKDKYGIMRIDRNYL